jgi:hypothetical protein
MEPARICCLQTVDELVYNEPLETALFRSEVAKTAKRFRDPLIEETGVGILEEVKATGNVVSSASILPGNISFVAALLPGSIRCVILEVKRDTPETRLCRKRYEKLCERHGIALHVVAGNWRRFTGEKRLVEKARFEFDILCKARGEEINGLMFDRAMFYSGLLIHSKSPLCKNVLNSHPGLLRGAKKNPGKSPIRESFRRKVVDGETVSTVSVHRADFDIDGGEIIEEEEFDIGDVQSAEHLRTRVYSGIEAHVQCRALRSLKFEAVDWSTLRFPAVGEIERIYKAITPPHV